MRRFAVSLIPLTLAIGTLPAQRPALRDHPRVREALTLLELWVDAKRAYEAIPGASLAVVHDQDVLWAQGFGSADRERGTPATPETIYSICSISKLFTAIAVMQQRDSGRLRLDDPVSRHLPWFTLKDQFPDAPPVTIEGLLTHASGVPRESDYPYWSAPDFAFPTREQLLARLADQEELYPAFEYHQYSNLGLTLAGEVAAAAAQTTYAAYVRASILAPLGLARTTPEIPTAEYGRAMARGYAARQRDGSRPVVAPFEGRAIAPAMGFASTVLDLGRFAAWQFRVLHHGAREVLRRNTLREMYRVHWLDPDWELKWGLGFATWRTGDKTYVGHGGSCPGYRSSLSVQPESRIAVVFMANASGVNAGLFTRRAHEIVGPSVAEALDTARTPRPGDAALEAYVGRYDEFPWGGETLVFRWKGALAAVGVPTDDPLGDLVELRPVAGHRFRRVRKDGALGEEVRFEVGPDGRATRMWWHSNVVPRAR